MRAVPLYKRCCSVPTEQNIIFYYNYQAFLAKISATEMKQAQKFDLLHGQT